LHPLAFDRPPYVPHRAVIGASKRARVPAAQSGQLFRQAESFFGCAAPRSVDVLDSAETPCRSGVAIPSDCALVGRVVETHERSPVRLPCRPREAVSWPHRRIVGVQNSARRSSPSAASQSTSGPLRVGRPSTIESSIRRPQIPQAVSILAATPRAAGIPIAS
jgi:hypothetical protein